MPEQLTWTEMTWTVHPARRWPAVTLGVAALTVLAGWACADWGGAWGWGVFAAALLTVSLRRFYLPTTYRLDAEGIAVQNLARVDHLPWSEIRRFRYDERGAFASSRAQPSLRDRYAGLHIVFGGHAEAAADFARHYVSKAAIVRRVNAAVSQSANEPAAVHQRTEAV